jgi:hypothetical protein
MIIMDGDAEEGLGAFWDPTDWVNPLDGGTNGAAVGTLLGALLLFEVKDTVGTGKSEEGDTEAESEGSIDTMGLVESGPPDSMIAVGLADKVTGGLVIGASDMGAGSVGASGADVVWMGVAVTGTDNRGAAVGEFVIGSAKAVQISEAACPLETNAMETFKIGGTPSLVIVPYTSARNPTSRPSPLSLVHVWQAG